MFPRDYTGENVTPQIFLAVLAGDAKVRREVFPVVLAGLVQGVEGRGSGKVLDSGPQDHVFVYFADHGLYPTPPLQTWKKTIFYTNMVSAKIHLPKEKNCKYPPKNASFSKQTPLNCQNCKEIEKTRSKK